MSNALQRSISVGLTICVLLLSAVASALTVEHAVDHAHHQAATHATVLCSWMCAAGQVLEGVAVNLHVQSGPVTLLSVLPKPDPLGTDLPFSPTRGPPTFTH